MLKLKEIPGIALVRSVLFGQPQGGHFAKLDEEVVKSYGQLGCTMSLKVYIFDAYLDKFKNMGTYSEEKGERFHLDITNLEHKYLGVYKENIMVEYIKGLVRESN